MNIGVVVDNEFDHDHRVQKEIRLLRNEGHTIFVICFDFGKQYETYNHINVSRIRISQRLKNILFALSANFIFYDFLWQKNITEFIKANRLEALHVHDLYLAKAARKGIEKSKYSIPLTLDLHENYPAAINSYQWAVKGWRKYVVQPQKWYKKESEYLNYADNLIVLSHYFKQNLISRFPFLKSSRIQVHPNMPDFESYEAFEKDEYFVEFTPLLPTLFYFGVVAKRRGIIAVLPWIIKLLKSGKQFQTLIIGPVDKADKNLFHHYLSHPILKDKLTYLPWADVKYLPAYLKKITIGLAPFEPNAQHDSGVANKLFQYMYGKIPILATKCKAQQDLIEDSECGLLYETYDDFNMQLTLLLDNVDLRNRLGENGKKKLLELYKIEADRQFLKIYNNV